MNKEQRDFKFLVDLITNHRHDKDGKIVIDNSKEVLQEAIKRGLQ